jgi:hypothetical protein
VSGWVLVPEGIEQGLARVAECLTARSRDSEVAQLPVRVTQTHNQRGGRQVVAIGPLGHNALEGGQKRQPLLGERPQGAEVRVAAPLGDEDLPFELRAPAAVNGRPCTSSGNHGAARSPGNAGMPVGRADERLEAIGRIA